MTLLIACLLMHMMGMSWYWYVIATIIWIGHLALHTIGER